MFWNKDFHGTKKVMTSLYEYETYLNTSVNVEIRYVSKEGSNKNIRVVYLKTVFLQQDLSQYVITTL